MKRSNPTWSLCHATARLPDGWKQAARAWQENADNPLALEYILAVHENDIHKLPLNGRDLADRVIINRKRSCSVDNWNAAAEAARGQILITVSDDIFPPPHWDGHILSVVPDPKKQVCVWVSTGGNEELMQFSIETRPHYEKYGYMYWHEYESMYCDNDFQARAERDGVIIDCRRTLPVFEHRHPAFGKGQQDEVYAKENRPEAYALGKEVFERRKREGFV